MVCLDHECDALGVIRGTPGTDNMLAGPLQSRIDLLHAAWTGRCGLVFPRCAVAAKVHVLGRPPETTRAGSGVGAWRMTGADTRMRPPEHLHVATVDGVQPAVGMPPKDAVCAVQSNRQLGRGDALAAPLSAARVRPVRDLFRAGRRLRGVATAQALILSLLAPEGAAGAVRRGNERAGHGLALL